MSNYDKFYHSYVYRFDNIKNNKWYIGARWNYYCDPSDDEYTSSSDNPEFREALANGELKKTVICEFNKTNLPVTVVYDDEVITITDVVTLALWVEDQLIRSGWRKYGKKSSYNRRAQFKKNIAFNSSSEALSKAQKLRWTDELRKLKSESSKGESNPFYGKHHTNEFKEEDRKRTTKLWEDPEFRKMMSDAHKGKIFIHKDGITKYINPDEFPYYEGLGYERGRANKCEHPYQNPNKGLNISKSKKGIPATRALWKDPQGNEHNMSITNAKRFHSDWVMIKRI